MTNTLQKKLYESGYLIVKNILDYRRDLKPVLNDMEFVIDCLIQKYAKKTEIQKILNLNFNPISVFICQDQAGKDCLIIYEVHNTFGEEIKRRERNRCLIG